jgi:hypothetical protein
MSSQPQLKKTRKTLFSYYKKESKDQSTSETNSSSNINVSILDEPPSSEPQIVQSTQVDISFFFPLFRIVSIVFALYIYTYIYFAYI